MRMTPPFALALILGISSAGCSEHELRSLEAADEPAVGSSTPTTAADGSTPEQPPQDPSQPVADAGPDQERVPLEMVDVDGSGSHDPSGGEIVAWRWALASAPSGSTAELSDPDAVRPSFFADLAGTYVLELTVQNDAGAWDETPDEVHVEVVPADGFYVELSWDTGVDLDLHLMEEGADLFEPGDCNYCNMNPSWGAAGRADDPSLDWDSIMGFGPETITIDVPADGVYEVAVHYYGIAGATDCGVPCPETTATVRVYLGGVLASEHTGTLYEDGDVWTVGRIDWPEGQVLTDDVLGYTELTQCW